MYGADVRTITYPVPYGWVIIFGILIIVWTLFQCSGLLGKWDINLHPEEINEAVTVTASGGYISAHTWTPDNSNWHSVVSDSSVPVDAVAKAEDGHILLTHKNLLPGGSFCFESEKPCVITIAAS